MRDFGKSLAGLELSDELSNEGLSRRAGKFIETRVYDILVTDIGEATGTTAVDLNSYHMEQNNKIKQVIDFYRPNVDRNEPNSLYIWSDANARSKGRNGRQAMRIGRALRRMFPVLTDSEIDKMVDEVKAKLLAKDLTLKTGTDAASFRKAYSYEQASYENVDTSWSKKHMANSCMRYSFDSLPKHPAEAYASGEFTMLWLETPSGQIAGRCVVWTKPEIPQAAPIYCVSEAAYEMLDEQLYRMGARRADSASWTGACLVAHPYDDGWLAPYLDLEPRALRVWGDYLVVDECGVIDGSNYGGILRDGDRYYCEDCSDGIHEMDVTHVQDRAICPSCLESSYFRCEYSDEYYHESDAREVYSRHWNGNTVVQLWDSYYADEYAVECTDGTLWYQEYVYTTADGEAISADQYDNEYFTCWLSDEVYHNDDAQVLEDGELTTLEQIQEFNKSDRVYEYVQNELTGEWSSQLKKEEGEQCIA